MLEHPGKLYWFWHSEISSRNVHFTYYNVVLQHSSLLFYLFFMLFLIYYRWLCCSCGFIPFLSVSAVQVIGENQELVLFSAWHHGSTTVHQNHIFSMLFSIQFIASVSQLCCGCSVPLCNSFLPLSGLVCLSVLETNEICGVGWRQCSHWGMRKQYDHGPALVQQAQIHLSNVIMLS